MTLAKPKLSLRDKLFRAALKQAKLPYPEAEWPFHHARKWRFDYAWPAALSASFPHECHHRLALEVEGGVWTQGRHTRGAGFTKDLEKYNEATALGWRVLRVTPDQLCTAQTMDWIRRALAR